MKQNSAKILFFIIIIIALLGLINSPEALLLGLVFSIMFQHPYSEKSKVTIHYLLKLSIVGLGFGMSVIETLAISKTSFALTFYSICLTMGLGLLLVKLLKLEKNLGYLVTAGTAICGGSAIAAISPIIKANAQSMSMALGTVFFLNAIALLIFPSIGHFLSLSQEQFGLWCAIAIQDTSSVVGAALAYGDEALKVATTAKLSRSLWIIPLSIFTMFLFKTKGQRLCIPYFIGFFILAIIINSVGMIPASVSGFIVLLSKRLLLVTLFLVGSTISLADLKTAGIKPLLLAVILWVFVSVFSLLYITY